jgi:hypothetical protein
MPRRKQEPEVIVHVEYVVDPENVRAAQEILKEGYRRALLKRLKEQAVPDSRAD